LGSPVGAATSSFLSFAIGALIPLFPWFFGSGTAAVVASVILGLVACAVVGALLSRFTGRSVVFSAGRQVLIATIAGAVTFLVGNLVGVGAGRAEHPRRSYTTPMYARSTWSTVNPMLVYSRTAGSLAASTYSIPRSTPRLRCIQSRPASVSARPSLWPPKSG